MYFIWFLKIPGMRMASKCRRKMVNKVKRSLDSPKMFLYFFNPEGWGREGEMERLRVECNESEWGKMPQPRHQSIRWSWQRYSKVFTLTEALIKKPLNRRAWVRNAGMYESMAGPASLEAQMVKNLPAMWENQIWSLGREDPLEKGIAFHSSILA